MTKEEIKIQLQNYLDKFGDFCREKNVNMAGISIDHICHKCESKEEYEQIRSILEKEEAYIHQSIISERRIAYVGFKAPLQSICGPVYYLELSDQKPDSSQRSGPDHIEPIPNLISYEEMKDRFAKTGVLMEESIKPHHSTFDMNLPNGVNLKMSREPLVNKIIRDEFILSKSD